MTLKAGDVYKGELYFGTEDNQKIRGYITSSNRRVVPGTEKFSGTTVRLQYGIDGAGMHPGERHEGWLCFTTDIGEYKLPFLIQTEKAELKSAAGDVPDMDTFVNIAKDDFKEAYRVFTDRRFELLLRNAGQKEKALYKGLSKQPVTFQHVEEFLIGTGKKDPVKIELKADQNSFYDISESVRETFAVQRSGWGHLRLEVEAKGDFLEVSRHVVTDEDFIGSYYQVEYVIRKEKLKKGDVIYSVNNELITSVKQLSELLEKCTKGTAVTLEIHRTIPAQTEGAEPTEQILTGKIILDVRGNVLYRSTPNYVQGITFSGDRTIFSCSYGRNSTKKRFISELQVYNRADATDDTMLGELELAVALPPMVEEVEVVGDEVYMIFESAATTYLELSLIHI